MSVSNDLQEREQRINDRLARIHQRIDWIADEEARTAVVKGLAARGHFLPEKQRLIDETDQLLDELEAILAKVSDLRSSF